MKIKANQIEHWDDERELGNGVIVTLRYGYSFEPNEHQGVRGFDTVTEARRESALFNIHQCKCELCVSEIAKQRGKQ